MQTEFTPFMSLFGGALIGLAAVVLMATTGRIMGASGIIARLLPPVTNSGGGVWAALCFIIGMLLAAPIFQLATGSVPSPTMVAGPLVLIACGLLVGFGTGIGSGCTSGHGVCGLSRLSVRSLAATGMFMLTAALTVFIVRHAL